MVEKDVDPDVQHSDGETISATEQNDPPMLGSGKKKKYEHTSGSVDEREAKKPCLSGLHQPYDDKTASLDTPSLATTKSSTAAAPEATAVVEPTSKSISPKQDLANVESTPVPCSEDTVQVGQSAEHVHTPKDSRTGELNLASFVTFEWQL